MKRSLQSLRQEAIRLILELSNEECAAVLKELNISKEYETKSPEERAVRRNCAPKKQMSNEND